MPEKQPQDTVFPFRALCAAVVGTRYAQHLPLTVRIAAPEHFQLPVQMGVRLQVLRFAPDYCDRGGSASYFLTVLQGSCWQQAALFVPFLPSDANGELPYSALASACPHRLAAHSAGRKPFHCAPMLLNCVALHRF